MKYSINKLIGFPISATDGELGKVSEFYFDDYSWRIRYLVVETGSWLLERKVLIPQSALDKTDWDSENFKVKLTMEQVRKSPDIDTDKPVSRQNEIDLLNYYVLPNYWQDNLFATPAGIIPIIPVNGPEIARIRKEKEDHSHDDPHLRSTNEIKGYNIHAIDGEIGHVEDFIIDETKWNINYLVVDTKKWLPGRKVLLLPQWIDHIDWGESKVYVHLLMDIIKNSPEYDASKPLSNDYEMELINHYEENI